MPPAYRFVLFLGGPIMRRWARLRVTGVECLPPDGPVLLVADHDSYWDPIAIAVAARQVRPVRALAKSTLWKTRFVASLMNSMGHIPVHRGAGNAEAMATAERELRAGACIGVFPEATRSLGRELRARTGISRLAEAVPKAAVVCVRTTGSVDVVRVPKRPSVTVDFYLPAGGGRQPGEPAQDFADRLVAELRTDAQREIPGRRRTAAKYRRALDDDQR
ncbi:lysophospholipid acyltransferase family protein [uncultured Jatrophihabitans sp.]|uniref:lysophospholipid acyltransferase family protein n=1 Tax=uncultured Jatrophihabitans sp. TaxID=1610747 RepID=UPI0035CC411C